MSSRLKAKIAMSINDFPEIISGNDVKLELISQFDWFKDVSQKELDDIIDHTSAKEFQEMADEVMEYVIPRAMDNYTIKTIYTREFATELRWLLARALYVDKFSIIVNLIQSSQPADTAIFNRPLMFSSTLYTARRLRALQNEGYISFDASFKNRTDENERPLDTISDNQLTNMINQAHEIAIKRALKSPLATRILTQVANSRLNIITDEYWVRKGIRK